MTSFQNHCWVLFPLNTHSSYFELSLLSVLGNLRLVTMRNVCFFILLHDVFNSVSACYVFIRHCCLQARSYNPKWFSKKRIGITKIKITFRVPLLLLIKNWVRLQHRFKQQRRDPAGYLCSVFLCLILEGYVCFWKLKFIRKSNFRNECLASG